MHGQDPCTDYLPTVIWRRARKFIQTLLHEGDKTHQRTPPECKQEQPSETSSGDNLTIAGRGESGNLHVHRKKNVQPFFMILSTPSCHAPFTPEEKYSSNFSDCQTPRTSNFNVKNDKSKHWLLRIGEQPLSEGLVEKIDDIFRNRLRTLLSVDDMVGDVVSLLREKNLLDNTYVIFTSDNGYHLGQFSLPLDKRQPYEFDIRVPLFFRGPGIQEGVVLPQSTINVDLAPTILDLAGVPVPKNMDGISLKPLLLHNSFTNSLHETFKDNEDNDSIVENETEASSVNSNVSANSNLNSVSARNSIDNNNARTLSSNSYSRNFLIEHNGEGYPEQSSVECAHLGSGLYGCTSEFDCKCSDSWNNTFACVRQLHVSQTVTLFSTVDDEDGEGNEDAREFKNEEIGDPSSASEYKIVKNTVFCKWKDNDNFIEYYDLGKDVDQLNNTVSDLSDTERLYYLELLGKLQKCSGKSCFS